MAGRVPVRLLVMLWPSRAIRQPLHSVILVYIFWMLGDKFYCLWPQTRDRLRGVVEVDREAVSLIIVLHVGEDVVVHIAEEMDIGLNTPVVASIRQSWVFVKEP